MTLNGPRAVLLRFARSGGAGLLATLADLATLTALVSLVHIAPRAASVPALIAGNVTMFFGQKYLAFRSSSAATREVPLFILVQGGGFVLNAGLYEFAMRIVPNAAPLYIVIRLVTSNIIWLAYSFPLWHVVFKSRTPSA